MKKHSRAGAEWWWAVTKHKVGPVPRHRLFWRMVYGVRGARWEGLWDAVYGIGPASAPLWGGEMDGAAWGRCGVALERGMREEAARQDGFLWGMIKTS